MVALVTVVAIVVAVVPSLVVAVATSYSVAARNSVAVVPARRVAVAVVTDGHVSAFLGGVVGICCSSAGCVVVGRVERTADTAR